MKAVFVIYKINHQNQRFIWPAVSCGCCALLPNTSQSGTLSWRSFPSLFHLAATRTLTTFKPKKTYYEILDLSPSATAKEVRQAFLKLSKQCHPDAHRNPGNRKSDKTFVQVNEAYSVLSKPTSRRNYDTSLSTAHHMSGSTYRPHSHSHHAETGHYTHYGGHHHYEADWMRNRSQQQSENIFTNFYTITACLTCATVAFILHYMQSYFPNPRLRGLRKDLKLHEIEQHDLIMTSQHDGMMVYYYAVPKADDPESYEVLAVKRSQVKDSDTHELEELNNVKYNTTPTAL